MPYGIAAAAVVGGVASNMAANKQAKSAKNAAEAEQQSAADSIAYQRETRDLANSKLSPFVNFATGSMNPSQSSAPATARDIPQTRENFDGDAYIAAHPEVADPNQWRSGDPYLHWQMYGNAAGAAYTPTANATAASTAPASGYAADSPLGMLSNMLTPQGQSDYLKNNPLFGIALNNANRSSNNSFLGRGKVGSATGQLVNNAFLAGAPLLQNQTSNLFNAVNIGQSSAAGQANTTFASGQGIANTIEGAGNANAAGIIGEGNAQAQGLYGTANSLSNAAGAYALFNKPSGAVQSGYGYGNNNYIDYGQAYA